MDKDVGAVVVGFDVYFSFSKTVIGATYRNKTPMNVSRRNVSGARCRSLWGNQIHRFVNLSLVRSAIHQREEEDKKLIPDVYLSKLGDLLHHLPCNNLNK